MMRAINRDHYPEPWCAKENRARAYPADRHGACWLIGDCHTGPLLSSEAALLHIEAAKKKPPAA